MAWYHECVTFPTDFTGVLPAVGALTLTSVLIFLLTTRRRSQTREEVNGSVPPTLSYKLPILGHLLEFLTGPKKFFTRATSYHGPSTPISIRLLNRRMTLLKGADNILTLFKTSRDLSTEHWVVDVLVNAFGVEANDAPFYLADDTGINVQPNPKSAMANPEPNPKSAMANPEHRIFHLVYDSLRRGLSGSNMRALTRQFIKSLTTQIDDADFSSNSWTEVSDLYSSVFRQCSFRASLVAVCGTHVTNLVPTFEHDFWTFDKHLPTLFKETPRWLAPAAYQARDKMTENVQRWQDFSREQYLERYGQLHDEEWDEVFGCWLMRRRYAIFRKMPLSDKSRAAEDLGLIWGAIANAVPATAWMMLEILQRPKLLAEFREIVAPFISEDPSNPRQILVDATKLCDQPLLQSIYAEVLRLYSTNVLNRSPASDFRLGGWHFKKSEPIIISSYNAGRDASVWNQGILDNPHSVDEFWARRFVWDPKDFNSGPVRSSVSSQQTSKEGHAQSIEPSFSLNGTAGAWIPYGGGLRMCPGRHFAKEEIILTSAIMLTSFDIELLGDPSSFIEPDLDYFMFGVMPPKGRIAARIRKRFV